MERKNPSTAVEKPHRCHVNQVIKVRLSCDKSDQETDIPVGQKNFLATSLCPNPIAWMPPTSHPKVVSAEPERGVQIPTLGSHRGPGEALSFLPVLVTMKTNRRP